MMRATTMPSGISTPQGQDHDPAVPCDARIEHVAGRATGRFEQVLKQRFHGYRVKGVGARYRRLFKDLAHPSKSPSKALNP